MVSSVKSHLRQSLPHEKQRTYTFCAAASLDENTPECLSLFTLWDMRHLLACWRSKTLASTSRWICSCDFVLPQCLNETSLSCWAFSCLVWFLDFIKQMTTASNKRTAGPVLGSGLQEWGGVHPLVFIRQSAGTQFRLRSPDVTRSHAGLFCAAAATELRKSGCTEVLLSLKNTADILLFNFSSGLSTSSRSRKCNYFCLG